jgi:ribosomal protein S21
MVKVKLRNGESLEQALRRFNSLLIKSGLFDDIKSTTNRYIKPSEKKRIQKKEQARRIKMHNRRK